jgi:acetyltransferase-like isoleucine patch superfamily enzyme
MLDCTIVDGLDSFDATTRGRKINRVNDFQRHHVVICHIYRVESGSAIISNLTIGWNCINGACFALARDFPNDLMASCAQARAIRLGMSHGENAA